MTITAAADGSALGNPGPAGWAWYVDDGTWAAGGFPRATNNIGELTAVLELLRATALTGESLRILCDSRYVIDSVTKWMPGWKRKGWRKADGSPVLNREIMEALDEAMQGRDVQFEWVKGHAGHDMNEAADVRARAAATAYQRGTPVDAGPGFPGAVEHAVERSVVESSAVESVSPAVASAPAAAAPSVDTAFSGTASTVVDDGLFSSTLFDDSFGEADETDASQFTEVTVRLDAAQHARLQSRARAAGVSIEDALRSLI